jgi:pimeloyl-ACP methyl ester carboxylesterase
MTTFGLVHGAWHGAWCWERLVPELVRRGHHAVAVDLPCDDPTAAATRYAELTDATLPRVDDLVLVGHSLGGLTIPLVAVRRPVRALVFLCAALPLPGRSLEQQVAADPDIYAPGYAAHPGRVAHPDGSTSWADADSVRSVFYQDCPPEEVARPWALLRRQARAPRSEACPLTAWPDVRSVSVLCREDRAINPAWSRRVARERLGRDAIELPGSHSPFWSRPAELAVLLDAVVAGG